MVGVLVRKSIDCNWEYLPQRRKGRKEGRGKKSIFLKKIIFFLGNLACFALCRESGFLIPTFRVNYGIRINTYMTTRRTTSSGRTVNWSRLVSAIRAISRRRFAAIRLDATRGRGRDRPTRASRGRPALWPLACVVERYPPVSFRARSCVLR